MSSKLGRSYRIIIDPKDGGDPIVVAMPLTIQFWVKRNVMASLNNMSIDIYNLGEANRARIFQDRFTNLDRTITIEAGYDTLSLLFDGFIFEANSSRQGTDIITRIDARTGSFDVQTTQTFQTVNKGQTVGDVLRILSNDFPSIVLGAIGDFKDKLLRPVVLNGNTYDNIKKYSDNKVFIDNNRIYILDDDDVLEGEVLVLNSETGLLGTPRRDDGFLTIETLFEPRVRVGQKLAIESSILPVYNGQYKVLGVTHQGMISESLGGNLRSSFNLLVANNVFTTRKDI